MINIQVESSLGADIPQADQINSWVQPWLRNYADGAELTLRFVDEAEALQLNQSYRQKDYATNVLSFPFDQDLPLETSYLGDIVICAPVVVREAEQQNKSVQAHYAHLIIHGVLHLLGFDHIESEQAEEMEQLEVRLLSELGFADPYQAIVS